MGVKMECVACVKARPMGMDATEFSRTVTFLDPSPRDGRFSILTVKCMRHGKVLFSVEVPMQCPAPPPKPAGLILPS